jgi:hypothetical protein
VSIETFVTVDRTLIYEHRLANKDYLKVADLAALEADYYRAIANYERVAKSAVNNNLMRYSVKNYFLKAGICHLASGVCSPFLSSNIKY